MTSTKVKEFYDNFTNTRMLQYKLYGNLRLEKAIRLITNYITPNSNVLDLGCGIGIVPQQVANKLDRGKILACDLGENNIKYAQKTIKANNIEFLNVDIIENFVEIRHKLSFPVDLVTMVDVIEHLPPESYGQLFINLSQVTSDRAKLILTYPSPEYQLYLQQHDPQELQIIDEVIEIKTLIKFALQSGFNLEYFSYIDVWRQNQYIHCVFGKERTCNPVAEVSLLAKVKRKIRAYKSKLLLPFIKRKYTDQSNK